MNNIITVREYARLTTRAVAEPTLSLAHIDSGDFDWLCQLNRNYMVSHEPALAQLEDS